MNTSFQDKLFLIGMWWRMGYGALRILFGLAFLKVVGVSLLDLITSFMSHELIEDPKDILYMFIKHHLTDHALYVSYFLALYFIFWGVIDIVLSYNLIRRKLWAFPLSLTLIALFVVYEIIRFSHTHSIVLLWIIFVDILIFGLIWKKYKDLKHIPLSS